MQNPKTGLFRTFHLACRPSENAAKVDITDPWNIAKKLGAPLDLCSVQHSFEFSSVTFNFWVRKVSVQYWIQVGFRAASRNCSLVFARKTAKTAGWSVASVSVLVGHCAQISRDASFPRQGDWLRIFSKVLLPDDANVLLLVWNAEHDTWLKWPVLNFRPLMSIL